MKIVAAKKILKANDQLAGENRTQFDERGVYCINLVGSPGCGKTTLLEALFARTRDRLAPGVIEGDIAGQVDAERIAALGLPVVQINTEGACHLDANMIQAAVRDLEPEAMNLLVVENVGNLVCTAGFDLGEHLRIVALSVPEGDDKLEKYPSIFQGSHALVVTKIDLAPHIDFRMERVLEAMRRLVPDAAIFQVSAKTGEGMDAFAEWVVARAGR